jgi:signal peptidase I
MDSPEIVSPFVAVSSDLLALGYAVRFRASGGSMRPAICDGDVITVAPVAPGRVAVGNVIVYRDCDRLFAHRIVSVGAGQGGHSRVLLRGDAVTTCDAPVTAAQLLGEVVAVRRRGGLSVRPSLQGITAHVLRAWRRRICGQRTNRRVP